MKTSVRRENLENNVDDRMQATGVEIDWRCLYYYTLPHGAHGAVHIIGLSFGSMHFIGLLVLRFVY